MTNQNLLRPMFSYSTLPIIIIIAIIIILIFLIKKPKIETIQKEQLVIVQPPKNDLSIIKKRYLTELRLLETNVSESRIITRKAYQQLSMLIRNFVYEVTQIKVQNYSLEEIKKLNMYSLTKLVEEYYRPEFAKDSDGFIKTSIGKTREVIEKWY